MRKAGKRVLSIMLAMSLVLPFGTMAVQAKGSAKEQNTDFGGSIENTDTQYTQSRYAEIAAKSVRKAELTAWKNDKAISEIVLFSRNCSLKNVSVQAGDLKSGTDIIEAENVKTMFIRSGKAYGGVYPGYGNVPADNGTNRAEVSDIIDQNTPVDLPWNSLQPVWVEFNIPKDAKAGVYTGTLTASADGIAEPLTFTYTVKVQDAVLPDASEFKDSFDIELWQYPYSSAEYYDVEPFSEEHYEIMRSSMRKYKEIGGHAITTTIAEEAWANRDNATWSWVGQTYSKNEIHYPSMVKWTQNVDGSFSYDYTDFDKWVSFNKSLGIGDKIVIYSIAPWHNSFTYWAKEGSGERLIYEPFSAGSQRYTEVWSDFLEDLVRHLEEKEWFEDSYIGIDERGFSKAAFDLIDSVKNSKGESLKTAGAMDAFMDKLELGMRVTDLNVGDYAAAGDAKHFEELLAEREKAGLRTTLYSCTGHMPGNFSMSMPAESYWTIVNAGRMGTAGFLRWAYDAWVEDPLNDTSHVNFEPGDCFLIYPDEKDSETRESKSSVRLERMAEGVRDVNKLMLMEKEFPELEEYVDALYADIEIQAAYSGGRYLSDVLRQQLYAEMKAFKDGVAEITERYVPLKQEKEHDAQVRKDFDTELASAETLLKDETVYTPESYAAFRSAYEAAKTLDSETAAIEELETAYQELIKAKDGLVKKPTESESETETETETDPGKGESKPPLPPAGEKDPPAVKLPAVGTLYRDKSGVYRVTKSDTESGTVTFVKPIRKTNRKFTVPATVKINGCAFKVTAIADKAFWRNKKLTAVTIGKNIQTIGKSVFEGDSGLKKITLTSASLKKAGKNAFKGIHAKCKIKVPKKKLKAYQKILRGKGQKSGVKITR